MHGAAAGSESDTEQTVKPKRAEVSAPRKAGGWQIVATTLRADIIFGRIHPREHLVEDEIMERFDISRHTARRAFDELQRLGLVVRQPNRGVYVRSFTASEVENLYELRELLETRAATSIPLPPPAGLIESLSSLAERHEKASVEERLEEVADLNTEFHETLYRACANPMLSEAIRMYSVQAQPIRMHYSTDAAWRRQAVSDHWRIIEALRLEKRDALAQLCREHLQGPKLHYLKLYHGGR